MFMMIIILYSYYTTRKNQLKGFIVIFTHATNNLVLWQSLVLYYR